MNHIALEVTGMHCQGCVRSLEKVLGKVPGLRITEVHVGGASVEVEGQPDESALRTAIEKAGFELAKVTPGPG